MNRTKIIGFGTGRCGTKSLSTLLSLQPDTLVKHESRLMAHIWNDRGEASFERVWSALHAIPKKFYGDVSFVHLNYIEQYLKQSEDIKIIFLDREIQATIESFWRWTERPEWPVNHWLKHKNGQYIPTSFDELMPKFDRVTQNKKTAISLYVLHYHKIAKELINKYPERIYVLKTIELNDVNKIHAMFDFIGMPKAERRIIKVHENKN